jgi:hypothetical protein
MIAQNNLSEIRGQVETVAKLHSAQKGPDEKKSDEIAQQIGKYLKWNRNY